MTADLAAWLVGDDGPIANDERDLRGLTHWDGEPEWWMPDWLTRDRLLTECAAKRKIIEAHFAWHTHPFVVCATCVNHAGDGPYADEMADGYGRQLWPCATLLALAQPYAGRPGWRDEWATT